MTQLGILAYQGDFQAHAKLLWTLGGSVFEVRTGKDLSRADALIIPGGESTTIGKLILRYNLHGELRNRISDGFPVFGTCAGAILLAQEITDYQQFSLAAIGIRARRNAYGRQVHSFEAPVSIFDQDASPFPGIFIRAPKFDILDDSVEILGEYAGEPVLLRQNSILIASFHPELTEDVRIHRYFLSMIKEN